jgi:hypothetical protein
MTNKTIIFSVFGQIEEVVARAMAEEGKCRLILPEHIPDSVAWRDGRRANCALVISRHNEREFDERVAKLRA